jgi:L-alanine-DL-glutamate epimerase-like enolase superfamily enzyme
MKPLRIVAVEATPINVPFNRPEVWSFGKVEGMTSIVVQIHTEDGSVGIGESVSGGPSIRLMLTAIQELAPLLDGQDATAITANLQRLTLAGGWHWYGRRTAVVLAGIEMALWDLLGKALGAPVYQLLGGAVRDELPFMYFLQRGETQPSDLLEEAKQAVGDGFDTIYVKGGSDVEADVELLTRLRETLGGSVRLRLDLNEAWMPSTAVRTLRRLECLDLEFVEQPVRFSDLDQLARLRLATAVPIAANQSGWTPRDILDIVKLGAADVIVTDAHQEGGIGGFRRVIQLCETAGLPVVYHAFTTLTIGITASMHAMAASPNCFHMGHQVYPPGMVTEDVVTEMLDAGNGRARLPDKPGLGLELEPDKLEQAAARFQQDGPYPLFDPESAPVWVPMG